jgi:hypothetical protein
VAVAVPAAEPFAGSIICVKFGEPVDDAVELIAFFGA